MTHEAARKTASEKAFLNAFPSLSVRRPSAEFLFEHCVSHVGLLNYLSAGARKLVRGLILDLRPARGQHLIPRASIRESDMRTKMRPALASLALMQALVFPAFGQAGPPAASSLQDISGCSLEGDSVLIVTGRDAAARRYKYPFDAAIDALCNAKGYAIAAPPKALAPPTATALGAGAAPGGSGSGFPPNVTTPTAQELSALLSGKSFRATYADGTPVRAKYGADGGLSANAPGFYDTGRWKAEDGKLCGSLRKIGAFCNDVRLGTGAFYLRRNSGEIVRYEPD
jgi:hypothetical protein